MIELYVSPQGRDDWSGRQAQPTGDGSDGPLKSLAAAQHAVRRAKSRLSEPEEIRVWLRGGRYELTEPWRFHAEDGGFGRQSNRLAQTWPVTWCAWPGETPVISGGRVIRGPWQAETLNGQTVYAASVPTELLEAGGFSQLWVNGERRDRPRLPKQGVWQVERGVHTTFSGHGHTHPSTCFGFAQDQIRGDWHNLHDVELHLFGWWVDRWVKIASVDEAEQVVHFDRTAKLRMEWSPGDGVDFVVENVLEALTEPGEWYLDKAAGKLYYLPVPGESMSGEGAVEVVAGMLPKLLEVDGGGGFGASGEGSEDFRGGGAGQIHFEGLTFAHNEWRLPSDQAGDKQAAIHVPAAVTVRRAEGIVFRGCRIEHVNTYGAEVLQGAVETHFQRCTLTDLGAGGVVIWHGCRRNSVQDCEIGPAGLIHAAGVGVLIGQATGNRVVHNHIHDLYYSGVSAGWNWGYAESGGYGNVIESNHIHDLGKGLLSDMGGIYLLGHACGTRLRYNHIHDITCRRYGGWCMYTDEGSTEVLMESNLCYRANKDPFHQHYGRHNVLRNNILAYGGDAVLAYGKPEPHLGLVFERNIFLSDAAPIIRKVSPERWTPQQTAFEQNLYWCEDGEVRFEGGGPTIYATQPFPGGFLLQTDRLQPLPAMPHLDTEPGEADWADAVEPGPFVTQSGQAKADADTATIQMLRIGQELRIHATLRRPPGAKQESGPIWLREHVELFLKPFDDREATVQLGVGSDGATEVIWHGVEAPDRFPWTATATAEGESWRAELRVPLDVIQAAADPAGTTPPRWGYLLGFAIPSESRDFAGWQALGHDFLGQAADPKFLAPHEGDFRLAPDSPALAMGFIPWDYHRAGPRPVTDPEAASPR